MKQNSSLSAALHLLLHMAQHEGPLTSEMLARPLGTNPVVIRRMMAGLRDQGYVRSEKGHGGGWTLACDLSRITLRDIYMALGSPSLLAIGAGRAGPFCLVEQAVQGALGPALADAEALLLARFGEVTLAALAADIHARHAARAGAARPELCHAS